MKRLLLCLMLLVASVNRGNAVEPKSYVRVPWLTWNENNLLEHIAETKTFGLNVQMSVDGELGSSDAYEINNLLGNVDRWIELGKKRYTQAKEISVTVVWIKMSAADFYEAKYNRETGKTTYNSYMSQG